MTTARTPLGTLRAFWRWLRRMRTAIILLLVLAAGSAVGSLFPQRPVDPGKVMVWISRHRGWAPLAEKLGLFDVFGAWWFMTIYGMLLTSLVGCLVPRYRAFVRALRSRPAARSSLEGLQRYESGIAAIAPVDALDGAQRVLRRRRFRIVRSADTVAAEKGHLREGGSLAFHTAFLVLLLGVSAGKFFGYTGQVAVVEGDEFFDTKVAYDSVTEGRYFSDRFTGFTLKLDRFEVGWWPNGVPRDFVSRVRVYDGEKLVRERSIEVNKPLSYDGVNVYQLSWGYAPAVRVTQKGKTLYDGPTIFLPRGTAFHGAVKLPSAQPQQLGLDLLFLPDPGEDAAGRLINRTQQPLAPLLLVQPYQGDLNLSVPQSVYSLDTRALVTLGEQKFLAIGDRTLLPNDVVVTFTGLRLYSVFQIAKNPGAPVLLLAAILILVGLIPALYSSRRRVWVRAVPADDASRIEIAGHALQRKAAFEEEFATLVRDLDRELYAARTHSAPREPAALSGASDA